jgi:serine/threonine protein kinase
MQAILDADYSFTPEKYWDGVSEQARAFIRSCLTVDPTQRQTAHQALQHPWLLPADAADADAPPAAARARDLLPTVRKNFNARVKLHAAIDTIRAINQLRAAHMNGAKAKQQQQRQPPAHVEREVDPAVQKPGPEAMEGVEGTGVLGSGADKMDVDR